MLLKAHSPLVKQIFSTSQSMVVMLLVRLRACGSNQVTVDTDLHTVTDSG